MQISAAQAQVISAEEKFQLLLQQLNIYQEYQNLSDEELQLFQESRQYAENEEYELASLYIEEVISLLKERVDNSKNIGEETLNPKFTVSAIQDLTFSILSGVDFNRQEFEIGYIQNDSTLLEEISKPYIGLSGRFFSQYDDNGFIEISNSIRYDQENLRNDFHTRWQPSDWIIINYGSFWNQSEDLVTSSFWEHEMQLKIGSGKRDIFSWSIREYFNYKSYRETNSYLSDYYRNRFHVLFEFDTINKSTIFLEYQNELNESLGFENMDYLQHGLQLGYRSSYFQSINYSILLEGVLRDYALQLEDSLVYNKYRQFGVEMYFKYPLHNKFRFEMQDNFIFKNYDIKSSLEPDYIWNLLRPGLYYEIFTDFEMGLGYEWELKLHKSKAIDSYDVNEQDYNAHGTFTALNYYTTNGMYLSLTIDYQWRRYPHSIINDLISIYSNRNIFSAMLIAYFPLFNKLQLNTFVTYDSDKDIDFDQQNNQSTIFSVELEYLF